MKAILAILLVASSLQAQNAGASPLADCLTSGDQWLHEGVPALDKLAAADLLSRSHSMDQCEEAYPRNSHVPQWKMLGRTFRQTLGVRALSFIRRHNLQDQFVQEDAAGKR